MTQAEGIRGAGKKMRFHVASFQGLGCRVFSFMVRFRVQGLGGQGSG